MIIPDDGTGPKMNALESIECAIAFDVRDWGADRRSAWIYAIVFGWGEEDDDEAWNEMREAHGWDDEDIKRAKQYHEQWEALKIKLEKDTMEALQKKLEEDAAREGAK